MNKPDSFDEVKNHVEREARSFLGESCQKIDFVETIEIPFDEGHPAHVDVYLVTLRSGKKVHATQGTWPVTKRLLHPVQLPDSDMAASKHIVDVLRVGGASETADELAELYELPEEFR